MLSKSLSRRLLLLVYKKRETKIEHISINQRVKVPPHRGLRDMGGSRVGSSNPSSTVNELGVVLMHVRRLNHPAGPPPGDAYPCHILDT